MIDAKKAAMQRFQEIEARMIDVSHRIHAHPELGFEEEQACSWLGEELANAGFQVESNYCGLPTAFRAKFGSGPLHVAFCAEYDSLPGIGHACGHNIIAATSLAAGIAASKVADEVGLTITVLGTPAEEVGDAGGKILLLERGAFEGIHAAMMVHPAPMDAVDPPFCAVAAFDVHYHGKASHASAFPELGINAADAMTVAQTAIGLYRQQMLSSDRIHGIITKGGDAPNIIPSHTCARYMVRSKTLADLEQLRPKVERCFEAGAVATGAKLEIVGGNKPYAQVVHDAGIAKLYRRNAESLQRTFPDLGPLKERITASTDMGNVSLKVPSIHPTIGIDSLPAVNHQPEFTAHCITPSADKAIRDGAVALAWTAIDIAKDAELCRLYTQKT